MEGQEGAEVAGGEQDLEPRNKRSAQQVLRTKFFKLTENIKDQAPHIMEMFNESHQTPEGKRQTQSDIINNCFKRSEDGKYWKLDLKSPFFTQAKKRYS